MVKVKWANAKCPCETHEESLANLKEGRDDYILCTREEGQSGQCSLEASKLEDDRYVCEVLFRNGSSYSYPGFLDYNSLQDLYVRFCNGESFDFVHSDWRKLQSSKSLNFLFILLVIALGCAIFYYVHTHH